MPKQEILIFLLAILIVSSFIELTYGSIYLGLIFLALSGLILIILSKGTKAAPKSKTSLTIIFGIIIVVGDLIYNYLTHSEIQTFDSMILLLGLSITLSASGTKFADLGRFGIYFSSIFLLFFIVLFIIPEKLNIDIPYYYGHYCVTLPAVFLLSSLGLNVRVPEKRLIEVFGVQNVTLKIDLACFGWYSMLLITSMLISYHLTIQKLESRKLVKVLLIMLIACYLANLLRVLILISTAYYYGIDTMMLLHSHIGWILFAIIVIPLSYILVSGQ